MRVYGFCEEIDEFLELYFKDRNIYYSARECGTRDKNKLQEVWIGGALDEGALGVITYSQSE
tara:strand:+ start:353 stop:538 length:186 start_codon:yes stop_codon:yes gene_type:complete